VLLFKLGYGGRVTVRVWTGFIVRISFMLGLGFHIGVSMCTYICVSICSYICACMCMYMCRKLWMSLF
jgi:hypothetical protein